MQEPKALSIIVKTSKEKNAHLYLIGKDVLISDIRIIKRSGLNGTEFEIKTWRNRYENIFLPLDRTTSD